MILASTKYLVVYWVNTDLGGIDCYGNKLLHNLLFDLDTLFIGSLLACRNCVVINSHFSMIEMILVQIITMM